MLIKFIHDALEYCKKNMIIVTLPAISVLGAALVIIGSYLDTTYNGNTPFINGVKNSGSLILAGGVFAFLMKSMQFSDIFKKEIAKMITSPDIYMTQGELIDAWKKLSKTINKNAAPGLAEEFENYVINTYFPSKHYTFRKCMALTITITDYTHPYITFSEDRSYTYIAGKHSDEKEFTLSGTIPLHNNSDTETTAELQYFTINNKVTDNLVDFSTSKNEKNLYHKMRFTIPSPGENHICYRLKKKYSIETNPQKVYTVKRYIKGMSIDVTYPDGLEVIFTSLGTITDFEDRGSTKNHLTMSYGGLVFPWQGVALFFRRKENV